ncbi:MAG TPA: redox-sensing transcriptional repressor Rex, partial [Mobilitalea sp.]|nr:redox-sensing transcriptional repressor Rex [Mobilitalea sp.]
MNKKEISKAVVNRLPRYYRYLGDLLEKDVVRISSKELSEKMNVTASQIRQDLNNFGGFGQQGYGYNVEYLHSEIGRILGLDKRYNVIIIGAGNLGQALANYVDFERRGFFISAIFDVNPRLIGMSIRGVEVQLVDGLEAFIRMNSVDIAAITVPKSKAPQLAADLALWGVKGIWNFAPTDLNLPKDITVENVH